MPYELLARLFTEPMPATFAGRADIDDVAVLRAAGLVDASIPDVLLCGATYAYEGPAAVTSITPLGMAVMQRRMGKAHAS